MAIAEKNPAIDKAWGVVKELSADEKARLIAESREKARRDYADQIKGAYRQVARNLLRMDMSVEKIAEATGLPVTEIERLAAESENS